MRTIEALSLTLLILCCTACTRTTPSKGFKLDVATSAATCGDGRDIVAVAIGGHRAKLNSEPDAPFREFALRLREVMGYRAEKILFVKATRDVPWGEFLELVDSVWPEVQAVSILTPQVEVLARRNFCLIPSCGRCTTGFGGFDTSNRP